MLKLFRKNGPNSRKGFLIFLVLIIGELFIPGEPKLISLNTAYILTVILIAFLYLFTRLVNSISHNGKLFKEKLTLNHIQQKLVCIIILYFVFLLIMNGNLQSIIFLSKSSPKIIVSCFATALGAGIFEEYFVRGYLFNLFQRILNKYNVKKYRLALISTITSLIFGMLHLTNLDGDSSKAVFQQVFYATCIGLIFSVTRITFNSIFVGAFLHFLFDLQVTIYQPLTADNWLNVIMLFLPIAVISILLIISIDHLLEKNSIEFLNP
ncbi:CPBP family intramembrane glutamic endopeptidase [Leuconostoc mesenteroides]|uniref:CPBP family intramembrane glutamic endopeptidase n=2 Tax=Leuconostoc mesenteroides TaxID=1245 RepID=UPI001CBEFAFD|nr:CPBP family intramembrane glutamic endopeptidase [Leuconostoc mesenteroides]